MEKVRLPLKASLRSLINVFVEKSSHFLCHDGDFAVKYSEIHFLMELLPNQE